MVTAVVKMKNLKGLRKLVKTKVTRVRLITSHLNTMTMVTRRNPRCEEFHHQRHHLHHLDTVTRAQNVYSNRSRNLPTISCRAHSPRKTSNSQVALLLSPNHLCLCIHPMRTLAQVQPRLSLQQAIKQSGHNFRLHYLLDIPHNRCSSPQQLVMLYR
jgi:hypothetical protein